MSGPAVGGGGDGDLFGNLFGSRDKNIEQNVPGYTIVRLPGNRNLQMLPAAPDTQTSSGAGGNIFLPGGQYGRHHFQFPADTSQGQQERSAVTQRIRQLQNQAIFGGATGAAPSNFPQPNYMQPGYKPPPGSGAPPGYVVPGAPPSTTGAPAPGGWQPMTFPGMTQTDAKVQYLAHQAGVPYTPGMTNKKLQDQIALQKYTARADAPSAPAAAGTTDIPNTSNAPTATLPDGSDRPTTGSEVKLFENAQSKGVVWKRWMGKKEIDDAVQQARLGKIIAGSKASNDPNVSMPSGILSKKDKDNYILATALGVPFTPGDTEADIGAAYKTGVRIGKIKPIDIKKLAGLPPEVAAPAIAAAAGATPAATIPTDVQQVPPPPLTPAAPSSPPPAPPQPSPVPSAPPVQDPQNLKSNSILDTLKDIWNKMTGPPTPAWDPESEEKQSLNLNQDQRYDALPEAANG